MEGRLHGVWAAQGLGWALRWDLRGVDSDHTEVVVKPLLRSRSAREPSFDPLPSLQFICQNPDLRHDHTGAEDYSDVFELRMWVQWIDKKDHLDEGLPRESCPRPDMSAFSARSDGLSITCTNSTGLSGRDRKA